MYYDSKEDLKEFFDYIYELNNQDFPEEFKFL